MVKQIILLLMLWLPACYCGSQDEGDTTVATEDAGAGEADMSMSHQPYPYKLCKAQTTDLVTQPAPPGGTWGPLTGVSLGQTQDVGNLTTKPNLQIDHLEPDIYTVQFVLIPPTAVGAFGTTASAVAVVRWKVQGQQVTRVLSVQNGTSISGTAEAVDIAIADNTGFMTNGFGSPAPGGRKYQVAATLCKGVRGATQVQPTLALSPGAIISTGVASPYPNGVTFPVPPDAGVNSFFLSVVWQTPGAAHSDLDIVASQFFGSTNNFAATYPLKEPSNGWIPLFPGATNISISNFNAANDTAFVNIIWGLDG